VHKAGFVNIIGLPNVGKSTLMNALVGERLSIITSKAQTTRHRIFGIVNDEDWQIVFSDTPGFVRRTAYKMHQAMNDFVTGSLEDADVILFVTDPYYSLEEQQELIDKVRDNQKVPILLLINKVDQLSPEKLNELMSQWTSTLPQARIMPISALEKAGTEGLLKHIISLLPENPPYFDKDALTDRPERFFVSEIIREKIFEQYKKEIPYSTEVGIEAFQEEEDIIRIRALIFVMRESQKNIIIGKGGQAIKQVGISARKDIEEFLQKKVYLELFVKVKENWRDDDRMLRSFGYQG
jgi:GTP-binding protein Era